MARPFVTYYREDKMNVIIKRGLLVAAALAVTIGAQPIIAKSTKAAGKANWKVGRVYNRLVCNACHRLDGGQVTSPYDRKMAEWNAYFKADIHAKGGPINASVRYYASQEYRSSIQHENKAAAKFLKVSSDEMMAHVIEFYIHGAKDSDTPARCQ